VANPVAEAHAKGKILGDEVRALEDRAGIAKKVENARLGPLIPDLNASSDEYFRDVDDYARRKVRDLYFGVQDLALRKKLIAKQRECERFHADVLAEMMQRAHQAVAKAQQRANSLPWLRAGLLAAIWVAIGAWLFQLYGALAGALVGFFSGQGVIARARTERAKQLRSAQEELDEEVKGQREVELRPAWFNEDEQRTGERDEAFDGESVIANYYATLRRAGERTALERART